MVKTNKAPFKKWLSKIFGKTPGDIVFNSFVYLFFIAFMIVCFYPFYYVLETSLKAYRVNEAGNPQVIFSLTAYQTVFADSGIMKSFLLSIFVTAVYVVLHVFFTLLAAYPLSKTHLRHRTGILLFVVITMLFSGGLIPFYILIRDLNLRNNVLVYIIPGVVSGYNVIITKNFFQGIPQELEEAAKIDGSNDFGILFKIYYPLSLPIIATIALWSGVGKWNNWMTTLLYIKDTNLYTIQYYLKTILGSTSTGGAQSGVIDPTIQNMTEAVKMAAIVVGLLPIIAIYPFVQKYFVKGVLIGSVKG